MFFFASNIPARIARFLGLDHEFQKKEPNSGFGPKFTVHTGAYQKRHINYFTLRFAQIQKFTLTSPANIDVQNPREIVA